MFSRRLLVVLIAAALSAGGYLAATEPIPIPYPSPVVSYAGEGSGLYAEATADQAQRYDDQTEVPAGAHLECPTAGCRSTRCHPFWQRGPVRRVVAAPFRWLFHRRYRWR